MRVRGNLNPEPVNIEPYFPEEGKVTVRICENVREVTEEKESPVKVYEYDEYTFVVPAKANLRSEIQDNLQDWIVTGRAMEVNENASMIQDMKSALDIMGVEDNA